MDVDIICKILKIKKGGVGGYPKAGNRDQGTGNRKSPVVWSVVMS
jgi:hypothetical protein